MTEYSNYMKQFSLNFIAFALLTALLLTSPAISLAQGGLSGQLVVIGGNIQDQNNFVTVNNENALSGRTVFSPAAITTAPGANAKIILAKLGSTILFSPSSATNLTFDNSSINVAVTSGTVTVQNIGQTKVNLSAPGGTIAFTNQPSAAQISVIGGKTQVCVSEGEVLYNGSSITAGLASCGATANKPLPKTNNTQPPSTGGPNYLVFGLIGAAVAAAIVGVVVLNNNNNSTPVSPTV